MCDEQRKQEVTCGGMGKRPREKERKGRKKSLCWVNYYYYYMRGVILVVMWLRIFSPSLIFSLFLFVRQGQRNEGMARAGVFPMDAGFFQPQRCTSETVVYQNKIFG